MIDNAKAAQDILMRLYGNILETNKDDDVIYWLNKQEVLTALALGYNALRHEIAEEPVEDRPYASDVVWYHCPNCDEVLNRTKEYPGLHVQIYADRCPACGQLIKWNFTTDSKPYGS